MIQLAANGWHRPSGRSRCGSLSLTIDGSRRFSWHKADLQRDSSSQIVTVNRSVGLIKCANDLCQSGMRQKPQNPP